MVDIGDFASKHKALVGVTFIGAIGAFFLLRSRSSSSSGAITETPGYQLASNPSGETVTISPNGLTTDTSGTGLSPTDTGTVSPSPTSTTPAPTPALSLTPTGPAGGSQPSIPPPISYQYSQPGTGWVGPATQALQALTPQASNLTANPSGGQLLYQEANGDFVQTLDTPANRQSILASGGKLIGGFVP